eukprot:403331512
MRNDSQSARQSIKYYHQKPQNQNASPLWNQDEDDKRRMSGLTNSGDIVKVKDSNYVITEDVADYTQYAQVSNKIDQSPNIQMMSASQVFINNDQLHRDSSHNNYSLLNYKNQNLSTQQMLQQQFRHQILQEFNNQSGVSPLKISAQNPIKTSMNNEERFKSEFSNQELIQMTGMTKQMLSANGNTIQGIKSQQNQSNHTQSVKPSQRGMTAIPSTSVFNYSLKSFNDSPQQDQANDENQHNYQQEDDNFSQGFKIMSKQSSQQFNQQLQDPVLGNKLSSNEMACYNVASQPALLNAYHRQAPSINIQNIQKDHSLYSDDQKKSVFLYSSSIDDNLQSQLQISQRITHNQNSKQLNQNVINNNNGQLSHRGSSKNSIQFFSQFNSNSSMGIGQTLMMPNSQQDIQNNASSNQNLMFKTTSSNFQLSSDLLTQSLSNNGTQSSLINFNPPPPNHPQILQTLGLNGTKTFSDTNADNDFEIKDDEDEIYDNQAPIHYMNNALNYQNEPDYPQQDNQHQYQSQEFHQHQQSYNRLESQSLQTQNNYLTQLTPTPGLTVTTNSNIQSQLSQYPRLQLKQVPQDESYNQSSDIDVQVSYVEDSFQQCDYDEYMEEKCSLSDNAQTDNDVEQQQNQFSTFSSQNLHSNQKSQNQKNQLSSGKPQAQSRSSSINHPSVKILSYDSNSGVASSNNQISGNNRSHMPTLSQTSQGLPPKNGRGNNTMSATGAGSDILKYGSIAFTDSTNLYQCQQQTPQLNNCLSEHLTTSNPKDSILKPHPQQLFQSQLFPHQNQSKNEVQQNSAQRYNNNRSHHKNQINFQKRSQSESHTKTNQTSSTPTDGLESNETFTHQTLSNNHNNPHSSKQVQNAVHISDTARKELNNYLHNSNNEDNDCAFEDQENTQEGQQDQLNFVETFGAMDQNQMPHSEQYTFNDEQEDINLFQNSKQASSTIYSGSASGNNSKVNYSTNPRDQQRHGYRQQINVNEQENEQNPDDYYGQEGGDNEEDPYGPQDNDYVQMGVNGKAQYGLKQKQSPNEYPKKESVVDRLMYHEKIKQQKIEQQRMMKQNQEMLECTRVPMISKNSLNILRQKDTNIPAYLDMETHYEQQRRKEDLKRLYDTQKLQEVTGKPQISQKAQSLTRDVSHLYNWQKDLQKKKEDLQRLKEEQEREDIEKHQQHGLHFVNKESKKMLKSKENVYANQKIEERLISIGVQNKIKKEQAAQIKVKEDIQIANKMHQKKEISDKYLLRKQNRENANQSTNDLTLSQSELRHISANKDRQDLYKKYYNEKKREAECKLLSTTSLQTAFNMSPKSKNYDPNGISRNNLYQSVQNTNQAQTLQQNFASSLSDTGNNPNSNFKMYGTQTFTHQGMPLSPIQYQSFQAGLNTQSHPFFDVQKPINYCSFGNMQGQQMHTSQSFRNPSISSINPYQTLQPMLSPLSTDQQNTTQTGNDIYQQMILQAKGSSLDGTQQSHHGSQSSACFNVKSNSVCHQSQGSASTSCFEAQENRAPNVQGVNSMKQLLPPKKIQQTANPNINLKNKNQKGGSNFSQTQKISVIPNNAASRSRSKSKEAQLYRSLSPRENRRVIGEGKYNKPEDNDKFYQRSRKWSKERQKKIEQQQEKVNLLETLKCTFKPQISEQSHKLMSPIDNRGRNMNMHSQNRQNAKLKQPTNFTREMLIDQLINSSISPLKDDEISCAATDSFLQDEANKNDPFFQQIVSAQTSKAELPGAIQEQKPINCGATNYQLFQQQQQQFQVPKNLINHSSHGINSAETTIKLQNEATVKPVYNNQNFVNTNNQQWQPQVQYQQSMLQLQQQEQMQHQQMYQMQQMQQMQMMQQQQQQQLYFQNQQPNMSNQNVNFLNYSSASSQSRQSQSSGQQQQMKQHSEYLPNYGLVNNYKLNQQSL